MIPVPLNTLRFFEVAARRGSFSAAAAELHVTPGAVSQQIQLLESRLKVMLFERTARGVVLTEPGERYACRLRAIFQSIDRATEEVITPTQHRLTIAVTPRFASKWLYPKVADFQEQHPNIEIDIRPSMSPVDFVQDRVDVAFIHGLGHWKDTQAHLLLSEELTPVCSPKLLTDHQPISSAQDLSRFRLLHVTPTMPDWADWLAAAGAGHPDASDGIQLETSRVALDLAIAGMGVALGRLPFVMDEIRSGQLVAPLPLKIPGRHAYYLVYPTEWQHREKIQTFVQWILSRHAVENI